MDHFDTFSSYVRFTFARDFIKKDPSEISFHYTKNKWEKTGDFLTKPVLKPIDFSGRNSRNPFFITALTIAALFVATVLFYPAMVSGFLTIPVVVGIKTALYTLTQITIVGLCLRTLGRLNNPVLMSEWDKHNLIPQRIGSIRI